MKGGHIKPTFWSLPHCSFFFESTKEKPTECHCATGEELKEVMTELFNDIDQVILLCVSTSWLGGLKWVIKHEEEYYHMLLGYERLGLNSDRS
jgi:hypothetical protein